MEKITLGETIGETCNRNNCVGIIQELEKNSCSCHINPPCSSCETDRNYCPECDWSGLEDQQNYAKNTSVSSFLSEIADQYTKKNQLLQNKMNGNLPITDIDYRIKEHTHSSQICEGVYPKEATRSDVEQKVKGTFGGRFEYFNNSKFKYIAYTD